MIFNTVNAVTFIVALVISIFFTWGVDKLTDRAAKRHRDREVDREKAAGVYGVSPVETRTYTTVNNTHSSINYNVSKLYLFELNGVYVIKSAIGWPECGNLYATYKELDSESLDDALSVLDSICPSCNVLLPSPVIFYPGNR